MAVPGVDHVGKKGPQAIDDAHQIDLEDPVHVVVGHLGQPLPRRHAGNGTQKRHGPERRLRLVLRLPNRSAIGDVARDSNGTPSRRADLSLRYYDPVHFYAAWARS